MKTIYEELKLWAQKNSNWFFDMGDCFKFEIKNHSFYVYPVNSRSTIDIKVYKKNGVFIESHNNIPAVSIAINYIHEMAGR